LTERELEIRRPMIDDALGTLRLEGLKPSADVIAWVDQFVAGKITFEELDHELEKLLGARQV
jgi:hypothetical protein